MNLWTVCRRIGMPVVCGICQLPFPQLSWRKAVEIPRDLRPTVDHIHPRSKGGPNTAENLRWTHYGCNTTRGSEDVTDELVEGLRHLRKVQLEDVKNVCS